MYGHGCPYVLGEPALLHDVCVVMCAHRRTQDAMLTRLTVPGPEQTSFFHRGFYYMGCGCVQVRGMAQCMLAHDVWHEMCDVKCGTVC